MNGQFKVIPTVFVAAIRNNEVVLVKRKNTSFMDGFYDLPSGHIEEGEDIKDAAARELKEETGLEVDTNDLKLFAITQCFITPERPYLYFMFRTNKWRGEPRLAEPELSEEVAAFHLDNLSNVTPYSLQALKHIDTKEPKFLMMGPANEE